MKEYKVETLAPIMILKKNNTTPVSKYVEEMINKEAIHGWKYHSMETMTEAKKGGCLNQVDNNTAVTYYVVIFERDIYE